MKKEFLLATFMGVLFFVITYVIILVISPKIALVLALLSGVLFYLAIFVIILIHKIMLAKKEKELEKTFSSPFFYKTNGNFYLANGKVENVTVYFFETGILCVCFSEKHGLFEKIQVQEINGYEYDQIHLNLYTCNGRVYQMILPDAEEVITRLREKGWL